MIPAIILAAAIGATLAVPALGGGSTGSGLSAGSAQVARTRLAVGAATVEFASPKPRLRKTAATEAELSITYELDIANDAASSLKWTGADQTLELSDGRRIKAQKVSRRIPAKSHTSVELTFEVDDDAQPVALHLRVADKRATVKIEARLAPTPTQTSR